MSLPITEHVVRTARHTTFHLASGDPAATPIVFLHGWPDLGVGWRHQLRCFADLGFRAVAPDMRGYGRSTVHPAKSDYAIEHAGEAWDFAPAGTGTGFQVIDLGPDRVESVTVVEA